MGDSELVAPAPAPTAPPWPLWCQVLLARIQSGDTLDQARDKPGSRVSPHTITKAQGLYPGFHAALDQARAGAYVVPGDVLRGFARAYGIPVLADAYHESRDKGIAPRDRVQNRRLVLEAAGAIGPAAQGQASGAQALAIQINVVTAPPKDP